MSGLRIAFLLPSFPELSETFLLRQVTGLLDRGHDVRILAHRRPGSRVHHPEVERRALLGRTRYLTGPEVGNAEGPRTPLPRMAGGPWGLAARFPGVVLEAMGSDPSPSRVRRLGAVRRVGTLASEPAPDIVHCHYGDIGLQYGFTARMWGCPMVVSFYGYDCSSFPRRFGTDVYAPLFRRASRVSVLSEAMASRLEELGCPPARIWIQPLSVDLATFAPPDQGRRDQGPPDQGPPDRGLPDRGRRDDGGLRILTVARLVEKKGIAYALEAVAALVHHAPGTEYRIAGEGPLAADLERQVVELGLERNVKFMGPVAEPQVVQAMQEADVFLLPSVTGEDGDQEGTPTVLLEAAACGLPVVSTRHAGIPEITRDGTTALLVAERDVAGLHAALRSLLENPEKRGQMGRAARAFVEARHGIEQVSGQLENVYRELIAAPHAAEDRT